ncbi:MAG: ATP-binding protein [Candidatus Aminicenantes bacterium]|nr:ATP-binding protein [Candidatus Aminicenantes bacterium]
MERKIDNELTNWKQDKNRKVLLVRGARQVGKTYSIRKLGESFKNFVEVNFEETPEIKTFFKKSLNPLELCEKLSIYFATPIKAGETLLFFDEIQACPDALKSLRFFYEKMPELHVIAAGSLLEFAIEEIPSFGVGRIRSLFMYPMTFSEYLIAAGEERMEKAIQNASPKNPLSPVIHEIILDKIKVFQLMGGMPEVVKTYLRERDLLICREVIDEILTTIKDDFAKYKNRFPTIRLQEVFASIIYQVGGKFKYSNISSGQIQVYKDALDLLVKAGLAYKVYHTAARGIPLGAQVNNKKFKVLFLDTGVYQRVLGLDLSSYIISDVRSLINKGNLAELFVGIELLAHRSSRIHPELYYWHREVRSSNAEVDYVISKKGKVIPIEVKAGTRGQMQSMHIFLKERELDEGLRISGENFGAYDNIKTIPIYAVRNILQADD